MEFPLFGVSFRPETEGITPIAYRYDFDGDGVIDIVASTDEAASFIYTASGTYRATVWASDGAGQTFIAEKTVVSQDRLAADALLSGRWNALSTSLQSQDIEGSLVNLLPGSRPKYRAIFTSLATQLPTIFASLSPPELIAIEGNKAQYRVKREQLWEGVPRPITYYVWFVRDEDGVWRIDAF